MRFGFFLREALRGLRRSSAPALAALHTVVMATHDYHIVDSMRRRVIELNEGVVSRDQSRGVYGVGR